MPWDCSCGTHVERDDEAACPACGQAKASWTLVADKTRTLSLSTKKPLYRGVGDDYVPRADGLDGFEVVETTELVTLEKRLVRQLAALELLPAPAHLLVVRVPAGKSGDVTLVPEVEDGEVAPVSFPTDGAAELRFLLVHGPGELAPELAPPGVHVVDVHEPTARGHAPQLGVAALTKKRTTLPIATALRAFVLSM